MWKPKIKGSAGLYPLGASTGGRFLVSSTSRVPEVLLVTAPLHRACVPAQPSLCLHFFCHW